MDFTIHLESWHQDSSPKILVESRSGTKESDKVRNSDYDKGLEILFERLGKYNIRIFKIVVEKALKKKNLSESQRILSLDYPIILTNKSQGNIKDIRIKLLKQQVP